MLRPRNLEKKGKAMKKDESMPVFVCENCGNTSRTKIDSCFRCKSKEIVQLSEENFLLIEKEAVRCYTEGQFYRTEDLRRIEPYFFNANRFVPGFSTECGDYKGRKFVINKEKTKYYCSPTYENQNFKIRDCNKIQKIEVKEKIDGSLRSPGFFSGGLMGSFLGEAIPTGTIYIRLETSDRAEPVVCLDILSQNQSQFSAMHDYCLETARTIYRKLKEIVGKDHITDEDLVSKLKELSELKQQGFLSEEEFILAKNKLLK